MRLLFLFFSDLIKNLLSEGSLLVLRRGQIVRLATQDYNDVDVDMRIVATLASILSFSLSLSRNIELDSCWKYTLIHVMGWS